MLSSPMRRLKGGFDLLRAGLFVMRGIWEEWGAGRLAT